MTSAVDTLPRSHSNPPQVQGWVALGYFSVYLGYLFAFRESEKLHWLSLVLVPVLIAIALAPAQQGRFREALASIGLRRGNLTRGILWAIGLGFAFSVFQAFGGQYASEIREIVASGQALWMFPLTLVLMLITAGVTEEVFFRGFLQTRVQSLTGSAWIAIAVVTIAFSLYHLPYAYFNPRWPSFGDWGAAWIAAFSNGVPGGIILGALYHKSQNNLIPCIILHSMINAAPAMTMIQFNVG